MNQENPSLKVEFIALVQYTMKKCIIGLKHKKTYCYRDLR